MSDLGLECQDDMPLKVVRVVGQIICQDAGREKQHPHQSRERPIDEI